MNHFPGVTKVQITDQNLEIEVVWDSNCLTRDSTLSSLARTRPRRNTEQHHLLTPSVFSSTPAENEEFARPIQTPHHQRRLSQSKTAPGNTNFPPPSENSHEIVANKGKEFIEMGQRDVENTGVTNYPNATDNDDTVCGSLASAAIFVFSILLIILTFPFSLCVCLKMVQVRPFFRFSINYFIIHVTSIICTP